MQIEFHIKEKLEDTHFAALNLCNMIEQLPASEINTTLSCQASIVAEKIQNILMSDEVKILYPLKEK